MLVEEIEKDLPYEIKCRVLLIYREKDKTGPTPDIIKLGIRKQKYI